MADFNCQDKHSGLQSQINILNQSVHEVLGVASRMTQYLDRFNEQYNDLKEMTKIVASLQRDMAVEKVKTYAIITVICGFVSALITMGINLFSK